MRQCVRHLGAAQSAGDLHALNVIHIIQRRGIVRVYGDIVHTIVFRNIVEVLPLVRDLVHIHRFFDDIQRTFRLIDTSECIYVARRRVGCKASQHLQAAAVVESILADARYQVADCHRCQAAAVAESILADARHRVGDCHRRQAAAAVESTLADARHRVGNDSTVTPGYQCIGRRLYYGIAIVSAVKYRVVFIYDYTCQAAAEGESTVADARHRHSDCHRCQAVAAEESILADACHRVGDCH